MATFSFGLITLFPELFTALNYGVSGQAIKRDRANYTCWDPRNFTEDKHRCVDDTPYGGGPGMVMMAEPLSKAIEAAKDQLGQSTHTLYLSPQGKPLTQKRLLCFAQKKKLLLICGRYEGIDERIIDTYVDEELSIGDYVLSGGELPAMVLMDGIIRLLPGVLGNEASHQCDSFMQGHLDHPHYTRPREWKGLCVPDVLLSGNHQAIADWRKKQALEKTRQKRPDLLIS